MSKPLLVVEPEKVLSLEQLKNIFSEVLDEKLSPLINELFSTLPKVKSPPPKYLRVRDVSQICNYTEGYIYELVRRDKIPVERIGRSLRFNPQQIEKWIKSKRPAIIDLGLQQLEKME